FGRELPARAAREFVGGGVEAVEDHRGLPQIHSTYHIAEPPCGLQSSSRTHREDLPITDDVARMHVLHAHPPSTERRVLWPARAPAKRADRALRARKNGAGVEQWVIEDGEVMGAVGYASIRPDGSKTMARIAFDTFEEVHPGAIEVTPRLAYMDEHGLTLQIVYPNILGFSGNLVMKVKDNHLPAFCFTAST